MTTRQRIIIETKRRGLKPSQLAKMAGLQSNQLYQYFKGERDLTGKSIDKVYEVLGSVIDNETINDLFDEHFADDCNEVFDARNEIIEFSEKVVELWLKTGQNHD